MGLDQSSFRARNDDGHEDDASWYAGEKINFTAPAGANKRIRLQISSLDDLPSAGYQVEIQKQGETGWEKVRSS